jgi:hypothetical protein
MTIENHAPVGKFGVNQTLELISLGMLLGKGFIESLASDKKIDLSDYLNFVPALMQIPDAFSGIAEVPSELGELAPEELITIRDHVLAALPTIGDKWLVVATSSFAIGSELLKILSALKL